MNVNAKNDQEETPLHLAIRQLTKSDQDKWSALKVVKMLIEHKADVNAKNMYEFTPLHSDLCFNGTIEIVKLLVDYGADLKARNNYSQQTPFLMACGVKANIEVIKFLYQKGSDINARDYKNRGPVHNAISDDNQIEIVKFLVENGAAVKVDYMEKSVLAKSAAEERLEIMKILLQNGATVDFNSFIFVNCVDWNISKQIIFSHLLRMKMLNLVDKKIYEEWKVIAETKEWKDFEEACEAEAKKLNEVICLDRNVTFVHILTKSVREVTNLLNVEDIKNSLNRVY